MAAKPDNNGTWCKLSNSEFVDSTNDAGEKGVATADVTTHPKLPISKIVKHVRFKSYIIDDVQKVVISFKAIISPGRWYTSEDQ